MYELEPRLLFSIMLWNCFFFNVVSYTNIQGKVIESPKICIILIEMLFQPCVFSASKVFMIGEISFWFTQKELTLALVLYANCGSVLPLFIGIHFDAKKSLKRLAFTWKSELNLLFLLYKNRFNIEPICFGSWFRLVII